MTAQLVAPVPLLQHQHLARHSAASGECRPRRARSGRSAQPRRRARR